MSVNISRRISIHLVLLAGFFSYNNAWHIRTHMIWHSHRDGEHKEKEVRQPDWQDNFNHQSDRRNPQHCSNCPCTCWETSRLSRGAGGSAQALPLACAQYITFHAHRQIKNGHRFLYHFHNQHHFIRHFHYFNTEGEKVTWQSTPHSRSTSGVIMCVFHWTCGRRCWRSSGRPAPKTGHLRQRRSRNLLLSTAKRMLDY